MSRLFQIYEADLSMLERVLPVLHDAAATGAGYLTAETQVAIEEAKRILSDVRWNYGPYSAVEAMPTNGGE